MTFPAIPRFTETPGLADYLKDLIREIQKGQQPQIGSQPYDANLQSLSSPFGLTAAGLALLDDTDASAQLTTLGVSAYIKTLLDDIDAATARATLGLGSAAIKELTDYVAYTPTFTGFGTPSGVDFRSRRVGQDLEIIGQFTCGTSTAVQARITMGFNGTNNNVVGSNTHIGAGGTLAGPLVSTLVLAGGFYANCTRNLGYMTFGASAAATAGYSNLNGSALAASGNQWSIRASIPIEGW